MTWKPVRTLTTCLAVLALPLAAGAPAAAYPVLDLRTGVDVMRGRAVAGSPSIPPNRPTSCR